MGYYDQAFSNIGSVIDKAALTIGGKILSKDIGKQNETDELKLNQEKLNVANQMKDLNAEDVQLKGEEEKLAGEQKELEKVTKQKEELMQQVDPETAKNFNDEWQEKYDAAMSSMQCRAEAMAIQRENFEKRKKLILEREELLEKKGGKK